MKGRELASPDPSTFTHSSAPSSPLTLDRTVTGSGDLRPTGPGCCGVRCARRDPLRRKRRKAV